MKKIIFLLLGILICIAAQPQNINPNDLKSIQVDKLTDEQVSQFVKNAEERGMTQEQLEALAISRGMPISEIQKLKKRIEKIQSQQQGQQKTPSAQRKFDFEPKEDDMFMELFDPVEKDTSQIKELQKIYGFSLFNNKNLTFEPSLNMATPQDYHLGPGDEIVINIWGASQQNYNLVVNPEGYIYIDDLGPILVNGLDMETAVKNIKSRLSAIYSGLSGKTPNTFAQISLGNIRSIKVNITGEAIMPGTYTLPSLASVFNALYYAGGPGINGSFRNIKLVRGNKEVAVIDIYEYLQTGALKENMILKDQDVIHIPTYKIRVETQGKVKRPGIYEMKEGEAFSQLMEYTGNVTKDAYTRYIKIIRNTHTERKVLDIMPEQWASFTLQNGDQVIIEPIIERYANRVEIKGAVYREGIFELTEQLTLKNLIEKAEGLREDAYMGRALVYRLDPNNKTKVISVNLKELMAHAGNDFPLNREDIVTVLSIFDIEEEFEVTIDGQVQFPGTYPYYEDLSLGELIASSGGLKESASYAKIDIARRIRNRNSTKPGREIAELFTFSVEEGLAMEDSALYFTLQPFDVVFIRKSPGYEEQKFVIIDGEIAFPGRYSIANKNNRISDLIEMAGGITSEAYIEGATLKRRVNIDEKERRKALRSIQKETGDTIEFDLEMEHVQSIGIELNEIIKQPGSKYDLLLEEGDMLEIPKELQTVAMTGAFLYPVTVRFDKNQGFRGYVTQAGGFTKDALRRKTYVIYANGSVKRTHSFLGIKNYPNVGPGAEIIVPRKPEKEDVSLQEIVGLGSMITSMSLVIVTLINNL
jgi:protein involved in polysaccharide export with SLBB domain